MSAGRRHDSDVDSLIAAITVDCYDEDEQHMAFENAFDEDANFPCPGTVLGHDIEVLSVATTQGRRELIATCRHGNRDYKIALLDIDLHADAATSRLLDAYRRWAGN
jgi:hypothetical protein